MLNVFGNHIFYLCTINTLYVYMACMYLYNQTSHIHVVSIYNLEQYTFIIILGKSKRDLVVDTFYLIEAE